MITKNRHACLFLFCMISFLFVTGFLSAQGQELSAQEQRDTTEVDNEIPEGMMENNLDSLLSSWMVQQLMIADADCMASSEDPVFSEETYIQRLADLPTIMEMPYNQIVRSYIDMYTKRRRTLVQYMLGMSKYYFPCIEQELDLLDLPIELKYLPIIESALNPKAVSRVGATGLWQFMLPTGKQYGLQSNSLMDERRDPIKSTKAAVVYLRDLYKIFGDWNLVLAAYNCGPGNVNKAIKRAGGKTDYWEIYYFLPKETRGYVPAFIAANYVMNYYWAHNLCPVVGDFSLNTDTIQVNTRLNLKEVANVLEINLDELRALNPQYKTDVVPGGETMECMLRLPVTCAKNFIELQDSIMTLSTTTLAQRRIAQPSDLDNMAATTSSGGKAYHRVKKNETLGSIARDYRVKVSELRRWNNLKSDLLSIGQKLVVRNG